MSKKKPPTSLTLDATGIGLESPSIADVLTFGSADEVRRKLVVMGSLLFNGMELSRIESEWLGRALVAIGSGQVDANRALRLVQRNNASFPSLYERRAIFAQYDDLYAQSGSQSRALELIAFWRLKSRRGHAPTHEELGAECERLKKLIQSREK